LGVRAPYNNTKSLLRLFSVAKRTMLTNGVMPMPPATNTHLACAGFAGSIVNKPLGPRYVSENPSFFSVSMFVNTPAFLMPNSNASRRFGEDATLYERTSGFWVAGSVVIIVMNCPGLNAGTGVPSACANSYPFTSAVSGRLTLSTRGVGGASGGITSELLLEGVLRVERVFLGHAASAFNPNPPFCPYALRGLRGHVQKVPHLPGRDALLQQAQENGVRQLRF
jgi:hypothetical protein